MTCSPRALSWDTSKKRATAPEASLWFWTLAYRYHKDRTPTYGYATTRVEAMADFAKSWRRE